MQDFRTFSELSGRFFGAAVADGGGGADNRRLKTYPSAMSGPHHPPTQVKCPRCESLNTKFCYYNNYNLSQPRHFCKSCRRYWTRGGVLRNVPVGGGCRKPKRSSSKSSSESSSTDKDRRRRNSGSRSSSDSSCLTPATASSNPDGSASLPDSVIMFNSSSTNPNPSNPSFVQSVQADSRPLPAAPEEIFSDAAGVYPSLVAAAANDQSFPRFNFANPPHFRHPDPPHRNLDDIRPQEFINQTAAGEPPPGKYPGSSIYWPPAMDPSFYYISGAADPSAYWNQSHWDDGDHLLYLP